MSDMNVEKISIKDIAQSENSRVVYKTADLSELMNSMKQNGMLQPIGVKKLGKGKYDCVWGNRRLVAAARLGWVDIQANIVDYDTDVDRDVLGLVENFKRVNTSVSEDGRMFQSLIDRGLNPAEIAARLSINGDRVTMALQVYRDVPKEYRKSVHHVALGKRKPTGVISALAAQTILGLKRRHKLTKSQTGQLLDYAKTEKANLSHINGIAPLIADGMKVAPAIKLMRSMSRVVMYIFIDSRTIKSLEKKHDESITTLIWEQLEKSKELGIQRHAGGTRLRHSVE